MSLEQAIQVFAHYGQPQADRLNAVKLKDARNRLIRKHHPDLGGDAETSALINAAYDSLKANDDGDDEPHADAAGAPWAQAGWSGGMPNSSSIYRQDYTDVNFIKKQMWELSNHASEEWTIMGFDGAYLRGTVTVYGSPKIFAEMAKAMIIWQTKGGNPYRCRAVLVSRRGSKRYQLIWADGRSYAADPIEVTSDSFNENPGNDPQFNDRLRHLIDQLDDDVTVDS